MTPLPPILFVMLARMILFLCARHGYTALLPVWNARVLGFVAGAFVGFVLLRFQGLIP